jgi:hypothetical protein
LGIELFEAIQIIEVHTFSQMLNDRNDFAANLAVFLY